MGRPPKTIKRTRKYTVRFTVTEDIILKRTATKFGRTVSEYIRMKSMDLEMKPIMSEIEVGVYRNLVGLSNNLNQLTKSVNQGNVLIQEELQVTLNEINKILAHIK